MTEEGRVETTPAGGDLPKRVESYRNNEHWWRKIKSGEYWEYYRQQYEQRLRKTK